MIMAAEDNHGSIVVSLLESELGVELDYRAKVSKIISFYLVLIFVYPSV